MKSYGKRVIISVSVVLSLILLLGACGPTGGKAKPDPKNPTTISVWHYYNGAIANAFETMVKDFNETVGAREGIIVDAYGMGNVGDLEKAVISSAKNEVGSPKMPNIFASYADTAYAAEKLNLLANLGDYLTADEQAEYLDSFITEGKIGLNGELRIFPIAKSTETFMINETDWLPFATANHLTYGDLATLEDIARVAKRYYEWTDAQTPAVPNDGKAFFGRDVMANLFILASKEFGTEIFSVAGGEVTLQVNPTVMRKIWDNYYVPYISGYFLSYGKFRSDDAKVGDLLAYVGSTASISYFPNEVSVDGVTHPVTAKVLPFPHFEGADNVMIQQGAGMVVTKGTPQEEYASVAFLKWFTEVENNIGFSLLSGYMPVKKAALDYDLLISSSEAAIGKPLDERASETLRIALEGVETGEMYTNRAFDGGAAARSVLERNLQDKAVADRESVVALLKDGKSLAEAVAQFNTDAAFEQWQNDLTQTLGEAIP